MRFFRVSKKELGITVDRFGRNRINAHLDMDDRLHEMFIRHGEKSFYPPEKHMGKDESVLMLEGKSCLRFYDQNGGMTAKRDLVPYGKDGDFYCRIPQGEMHHLAQEEEMVTKETTSGPWFKEHSIKDETAKRDDRCEDWMHSNGGYPPAHKPLGFIRVSEEAYYTTDPVVSVGKNEIERLKAEVNNTARKRIRLCTHRNTNQKLHEMFVVYTSGTLIQPNKHLGKDESFHILEGSADFIFYTDSGDVLEIIPLGTIDSGKPFFLRVPAGVYHTVIMTSPFMVIHEATPGPYDRAHTVWAPWETNYLKKQTARETV